MSISNRIILGFGAIIALMLLLGGYAIGQVGAVRATIDTIVGRDFAALDQLDKIEQSLSRMIEFRTAAVRSASIGAVRGEADPMAKWREQIQLAQDSLATLRQSATDYEANPISGERATQWRELIDEVRGTEGLLQEVRGTVEAQFTAIASGDKAGMLAREGGIMQSRQQILQQVAQIRVTLRNAIATGREAGEQAYDRSRLSVAVLIAAAALIGIVVALAIRRSIALKLEGFEGFAARVGQGELGVAAATGDDEIGRLGTHLNTMVAGLGGLARQTREATANLNAATTEIRASTQQQAASVEEQLAAIQETAATVDEITHSGAQITRRAQELIAAAQETASSSAAGTTAIDGTVRAMELIREQAETVASNIVELSEKTRAIGEIITTVNDISERSHLLALNASIEAAAAGEQGRSFAVVASEMKMLADQAKDSTRQVRQLLGEIQRGINSSVMLTEEAVKRAAAGKERTDTAQGTIEEMTARIQESVQTFQQIVASTNQQQIGIEQVTLALQNIRQASQQTAASTRQLDQAAGDLSTLSQTLLGLVERYRL